MEANGAHQHGLSKPLGTAVEKQNLTRTRWSWIPNFIAGACAKIYGLLAACWSACSAIRSQARQCEKQQSSGRVASNISEAFPEPGIPLKLDNPQDNEKNIEDADEELQSYPLEHEPLTRENILRCLPTAPKVPQPGSTCIVARVRSDVVVKYGSKRVHINEANTMRLVRQRTSVALPEVLDAWTSPDSGMSTSKASAPQLPVTYIVMRYVPGSLLHQKWPLMLEAERKMLVRRVADMLKELRTVELDRPGPVGDPVKCEGLYFTDYNAGPFETKDDLTRWLNNRLQVCKNFRRVPEDRPELVLERLVLCHMDLNDHNIIVAEDGSPWLIDWGCAGAYPPCFELGSMASCMGEFARMLEEEISVELDEPLLARLKEMTFAFTTGALCQRYDMEIDEEQ